MNLSDFINSKVKYAMRKEDSLTVKVAFTLPLMLTPTKWSDALPLVEREKRFECRQVEILRS